ncbi:MAG TPA: hypothetical protein VK777_21950 [Reyranella sp.]|nr:hypothetical protein [Reyranella sp.]
MTPAQPLQEMARWIEAQHLMGVAVSHQDGAVRCRVYVVRLGQHALAPAADEAAVAIEHQHRPIGAALRHVHAAFGIDHQIGQEAETFARRQTRPFAVDGVAPVAQDDGVSFVGHLSCQIGRERGGRQDGLCLQPQGSRK